MTSLDQQLQANREGLALCATLRKRLERCEAETLEHSQRLESLKRELDDQREEVEKLQGLGLTSLFHAVLGDKRERLSEERKELLQAKLRYDECLAVSKRLDQDGAGLRGRLDELGDLTAEREQLLALKEERVQQAGGEKAQKLFELADQIADARSSLSELTEALDSGELAQESLEEMLACLQSASHWGVYDMIGGGLIATSIKHSHIDKANGYAAEAQGDLLHFQNELADVDIHDELTVKISAFSTFADYFFDGLIFDWVVQSKIRESLAGTERTVKQVEEILEWLRSESSRLASRVEELEAQRASAIEGA